MLRKLDSSISWLKDFLHQQKFDIPVKAVGDPCVFLPESNGYRTPSIALKIGHSLKKCGVTEARADIKNADEKRRNNSDDSGE